MLINKLKIWVEDDQKRELQDKRLQKIAIIVKALIFIGVRVAQLATEQERKLLENNCKRYITLKMDYRLMIIWNFKGLLPTMNECMKSSPYTDVRNYYKT